MPDNGRSKDWSWTFFLVASAFIVEVFLLIAYLNGGFFVDHPSIFGHASAGLFIGGLLGLIVSSVSGRSLARCSRSSA